MISQLDYLRPPSMKHVQELPTVHLRQSYPHPSVFLVEINTSHTLFPNVKSSLGLSPVQGVCPDGLEASKGASEGLFNVSLLDLRVLPSSSLLSMQLLMSLVC
jgi:hypothetical protein